MTPQEGEEFLTKLLNKNLRVQTTDSRLFWGQFRCTDPDANVVLTSTYEYSPASRSKVASTTTATTSSDTQSGNVQQSMLGEMQSRYLGLVVVPGKHIVKIEVEEFLSQLPKTTKKAGSKFISFSIIIAVTTFSKSRSRNSDGSVGGSFRHIARPLTAPNVSVTVINATEERARLFGT